MEVDLKRDKIKLQLAFITWSGVMQETYFGSKPETPHARPIWWATSASDSFPLSALSILSFSDAFIVRLELALPCYTFNFPRARRESNLGTSPRLYFPYSSSNVFFSVHPTIIAVLQYDLLYIRRVAVLLHPTILGMCFHLRSVSRFFFFSSFSSFSSFSLSVLSSDSFLPYLSSSHFTPCCCSSDNNRIVLALHPSLLFIRA